MDPNGSPIHNMGASSLSPSPIATLPSKGTVSNTFLMASTAAPSAALPSLRPIHAEAAIAADSVASRKYFSKSLVNMLTA